MSIILDVLTVVIFAGVIWASYNKGLVRSVIELAGYVASLIAAFVFSRPVGEWIYRLWFKSIVYDSVSGYLSSASEGANEAWKGFLSQYHLSVDSLAAGKAAEQAILDAVVAPVAQSVGRGIAFLLIFIACLFAVKLIARLSDIVFRIPLIGGLNRLGGAAVGVIKAVIVLYLLCTLLMMVVPMLSLGQNPVINNDTINNTTILKHLYDTNPVKDILFKGR